MRNLDPNFYLGEGKFTRQSGSIAKIAEGVSKGAGIIQRIHRIVYDIPLLQNRWLEVFRNRPAEQIIEDNFVTGCSDRALVFVTIARACKVPAAYVETSKKEFIESQKLIVQGHAFVDVYNSKSGEWLAQNPSVGPAGRNGEEYLFLPDSKLEWSYIEAGRGLDFSGLSLNPKFFPDLHDAMDLRTMGQMRELALQMRGML